MAKFVIPYEPKAWQKEIHRNKAQFLCIMAHRGAGKTYASLVEAIRRSLQIKGDYLYVCPFLKQAIDNVWDIFKELLKNIDGVKFNVQKVTIELPNGSKWKLRGADNPSGLRGGHYNGLFADEVQSIPKKIWYSTIYPMTKRRNAWIISIGTPLEHEDLLADLYEKFKLRKNGDSQTYDIFRAGNYTEEEIKEEQKQYPPDEWAREFLCLVQPSLSASVYGDILEHLTEQGKIEFIEHDPNLPVYVAWDIGLQCDTALWFAQFDMENKGYKVIDYYESNEKQSDHYFELLWKKPYKYGIMILPHDTTRGHWKSDYDTIAKEFMNQGYKVMTVPQTGSVVKDIRSVRLFMNRCSFHIFKTQEGVNHLKFYEYKHDPKTGIVTNQIKKSKHNDAADAFRYLALGMEEINPYKQNEHEKQLVINTSWDELEI